MRTLNEAPVSYREAPVMMGPATGGLGEDVGWSPSLKLTFFAPEWPDGWNPKGRPIFRCKLAGFVSGRQGDICNWLRNGRTIYGFLIHKHPSNSCFFDFISTCQRKIAIVKNTPTHGIWKLVS